MGDLAAIQDWAAGLLAKLEPAARRQLAREIASKLRQSQQSRIGAQVNPDGSAFAPRKPQLRQRVGAVRRGAMFRKLKTRFLKMESSAESAVVGFAGQVERIARVHQYGLRDRIRNRGRSAGPEYQYPAREMIGFSAADVEMITDLILSHLSR
jgi:phage virion morphogenesis protein